MPSFDNGEHLENPADPDETWMELERKQALYEAQRDRAMSLLDETGIIAVDYEGEEVFFVLHPSTVIPDGWQVSCFDRRGPFGHSNGEEKEKVIADALECRDLSHVYPVTEQKFMQVSSTLEFIEGTKRVTFVGLDNQMRYEFGCGPEVMQYLTDAREAREIDEAISILSVGLRTLRKKA